MSLQVGEPLCGEQKKETQSDVIPAEAGIARVTAIFASSFVFFGSILLASFQRPPKTQRITATQEWEMGSPLRDL
jgi:hypothetical protein